MWATAPFLPSVCYSPSLSIGVSRDVDGDGRNMINYNVCTTVQALLQLHFVRCSPQKFVATFNNWASLSAFDQRTETINCNGSQLLTSCQVAIAYLSFRPSVCLSVCQSVSRFPIFQFFHAARFSGVVVNVLLRYYLSSVS